MQPTGRSVGRPAQLDETTFGFGGRPVFTRCGGPAQISKQLPVVMRVLKSGRKPAGWEIEQLGAEESICGWMVSQADLNYS